MCGIVGIFDHRGSVDPEKLKVACQTIAHRGPDASATYCQGGVGLGHQRLSIIDLTEAANQPMSDSDGQAVIVYNGELYNYRELRAGLLRRGHVFRTSGDTEVLLRMYLEYAEGALQYLEGMFAFAIWDHRQQKLFLARDRLGIKPLYYRLYDWGITFGSEIKALIALDSHDLRVDRQALHDYLTFRYTIAPRTMFAGISKLPPAHSMTIGPDRRAATTRYWFPDFRKVEKHSDDEWVRILRQRFTNSVHSHLVSDVPVGVLLSGGLDSSVVAAVMQAGLSQPIKTFSVAFVEGGFYDERPFARQLARHLGTDHHEVEITSKEFVEALPAFIWHMDEPVADPASIPLYYVAQLARRHVTVVLSGEGSDELLAGYAFWVQFKGYNRLRLFKKIPSIVREELLDRANRAWLRSERLGKYIKLSRLPISRYGAMVPFFQDDVFSEEEKAQLYDGQCPKLTDSLELVREAYASVEECELLDQMLYVSMAQWLPDDLLAKADKMTMAHSIELRVPFLDHQLVEFIAGMPTHLKVKKGSNGYEVKYALKQAFSDMIPKEILDRQKLGFAVPYAKWFRAEMNDMVHDVLLSQSAREFGVFQPAKVEGLLRDALAAPQVADQVWDPRAKKVWNLLVFELWRQRFRIAGF